MDDDQSEKIYTDLDAENDSDSLSTIRTGLWGEYSYKPVAQKLWDKEVRHAVAEISHDKIDNKDYFQRC